MSKLTLQTTDAFEVQGFVEQRKELDKLLMSNPAMEKKVQGLIRKVLGQVRKSMGDAAKSSMKSDPRQAYKAVRSAVYKRILGGNVNILTKRRVSGSRSSYTKQRKLREGQRGGNRLPRSIRTKRLESYTGPDRGFILRFINAGTQERTTLYGFRGHITARNFFGLRSQTEMENAAANLERMIDDLIKKELT